MPAALAPAEVVWALCDGALQPGYERSATSRENPLGPKSIKTSPIAHQNSIRPATFVSPDNYL